ncbi:TRAP transporter permease [Pelagibacterium lentulum]|uniref:C4-dicarboxylate ABC transporter n=1 Tax=Pelagibacterium lentulum TaxID=2029865 RepID=A0A916W2W3_9HYPH|nr:TRAP transporter fused permease subunit [Pelagibacterium lentulum]GGA61617.1 C4-dicarboxylate ABC transporter [Pelagibacterium lentulum]
MLKSFFTQKGAVPPELPQAQTFVPRPRPIAMLIVALSVVLCLFQLYTAGVNPLGLFYQRTIHLGLILMIAFLVFPVFGTHRKNGPVGAIIDTIFFCMAIVSGFYLAVFLDDIIARAGFWSQTDIIVAWIAVITLLEASRRVVGIGITIIGLVFILYALAGPRGALPWLGDFMPGILAHRGNTVERLGAQLYLGQEGIFGLPLGVAATYVFTFVLFGAVLEVTGAGRFFIDLAYAATGRRRGGPAKAAVVASTAMGSISGSTIANVMTTGPFTIPLMKRLGYKPAQAGGIEAAASTGGQITPPLMGAGAFLIAEYTGIPYLQIVLVSIFPAALYFMTVYLFVHIIAVKQGMKGMAASELPPVREVMARGWHFLVPLAVLIYLLVIGLSPMRVGFYAIVSIAVIAILKYSYDWLRNRPITDESGVSVTRLPVFDALKAGIFKAIEACEVGAKNALTVSIACAIGGIIVGVIGLTGLGLKFSSMMLAFSGGNILLALLLVLIASLILGFGLPVTAAYIVLIILVGPALSTEFGIPLLIVHLVVFWYSQDSNVTPPIALAGFAAAAVARSAPMETSVQAWKFAKGLYIIPLFMVFNPEIIIGGPLEIVLWNGALAITGTVAFVAVIEGFLFTRMPIVLRAILAGAATACLSPYFVAELAGISTCIAIIGFNAILASREERAERAA